MDEPILSIQNATKVFGGGFLSSSKPIVALDNFSLDVYEKKAQIITIAGESGSGKTTLANLILGFLPSTSGKITFNGMDLTKMNRDQRAFYRREVQAIFQDPYEVYNPFYRVSHIFNMIIRHFQLSKSYPEAQDLIEEALNLVGMRGGEILEKYPHQLSGGQRQRVMVARAYMLRPRLIVADEPVSAVDASLRAMILDIMLKLRDSRNISFLYITHDLSTAYQISDQMYVLFQGTTVERGETAKIIENPKHPYVRELIDSIPVPDPEMKWDTNISLPSEEVMRSTSSVGCRFYPRCPQHKDICLKAFPPTVKVEEGHEVACYLYL
jgi:peptide/nickel transport system ATP-binding protein